MRPVSLNGGRTELYNALKTMRLEWDAVRPNWHDAVSRDFEENHWGPFEPQTMAALQAIDRLDQVLVELQNQCGGE